MMYGNDSEDILMRRNIYIRVTIIVFLAVLGRFFYIQVLGGGEDYLSSRADVTRETDVIPTRGLIYDRNKVLIVDNTPAYSISVIPYELKSPEFFYKILTEQFPNDVKIITEKITNAPTQYQPIKIMNTTHAELTYFEENKLDLPGVISQVEPRREYPSGIRASLFLGYIKEIDENEIKTSGEDYYNSGDIIGKQGIERYYEKLLRGEKGLKYVLVDALGREIREIKTSNSKQSVVGYNLILTIDRDLQKKCEELLKDNTGAIVALNPQNGEMYAAVSKPDFEPTFMSSHFSQAELNQLLNDPRAPLYNRVTQSKYPPGSTFKLIGAIAALNENVITPEQTFVCTGTFRIGGKVHYCWKKEGHGRLNLIEAIEQSCNVYFYNLSQKLTFDQWSSYGKLFQFGEPTDVDIPGENGGILPDKDYMDRKYKSEGGWKEKGQMINLIIGQGDLLVTPLQMARLAGAIGTRGKLIQPHLLKYAVDPKTDSVVYVPKTTESQISSIRNDVWEAVRLGMHNVVNGSAGTARTVKHPEVLIAGKTGTSQNPQGEDHAWFIGYAPEENPVIAIAVFVENGGGGGKVAGPIAREIFKEFFRLEKLRSGKIVTESSDIQKQNGK